MAKSGGGGGRTPAGRIPPMKATDAPPSVNTEKSGKTPSLRQAIHNVARKNAAARKAAE